MKVSNTLGTAAGDFLSHKASGVGTLAGDGNYLEQGLGLTIAQGAMVTGGLILIVLLAYWFTKINRVFLFWLAFVLTRPFGATFGDYLIKPHEKGGLGLEMVQKSLPLFYWLFLLSASLFSWQQGNRE